MRDRCAVVRTLAKASVLLGLGWLAGCELNWVSLGELPRSDGVEQDPIPRIRHGDRLTSAALRAEDGTIVWRAWYDTRYEVECVTVLAEDGAMRCLPRAPDLNIAGSGHYADPECLEELVVGPRHSPLGLGPTPFLLDVEDIPEGTATVIHRSEPEPHAGTLHVLDDDRCVVAPAPSEPVHATQRVSPEQFVPMEEHVVDRGRRLGIRVRKGSDGSRRVIGAHDLRVGVDVGAGLDEQDDTRWLPRDAELAVKFEDGACRRPLATQRDGFVMQPQDCRSHPKLAVHRAMAPWPGSTVYEQAGGYCVVGATRPAQSLYETQWLEPDSFAQARSASIGAGTRLALMAWVDQVQVLELRGLEDPQLQASRSCRFSRDADGVWRCHPRYERVPARDLDSWFADPDCSEPVVPLPGYDQRCLLDRFVYVGTDGAGTITRLYEIGARHDGPIFSIGPEGCVMARPSSGFYRRGPLLPPDTFVTATLTTELPDDRF